MRWLRRNIEYALCWLIVVGCSTASLLLIVAEKFELAMALIPFLVIGCCGVSAFTRWRDE